MTSRPKAVAILGATATGKSALALVLAPEFSGEIVSVDSRQIYRGMDIGTAKPTAAERAQVRHHLIDVADPDETWSLAQYQRAVHGALEEIVTRAKLPILVGGTGQHMRAVVEGWRPPPRDPAVRARLEEEARRLGPEAMAQRLADLDPDSAARIDPRNTRRVVRALEILETTGRPASAQRRSEAPPFDIVRVGLALPRDELYARIDDRIDRMIQAGLEEEVRGLLQRGFARSLPSMSAIGYGEIAAHLEGELSLEEAVERMRRATRRLVRTQANWFRSADASIAWFTPTPGYESGVVGFLHDALNAADASSADPL